MVARVRLKNRIQIGSSIDKVLWEHAQQLSKQTRIPLSKLLDEALEDLLRKYQNKGYPITEQGKI